MAAAQVQAYTFLHSGGTYESVDLGLPSGTKWAKCNIGANTETEYGDLFAWGATKPYTIGVENTVNYSHNFASTIQRNLYPNEDAASIQWGKGWRIPTKAQVEELIVNTTPSYEQINDIYGYKFTSSNGNYIFIPSAGYAVNKIIGQSSSSGFVWLVDYSTNDLSWRLLIRNGSLGVGRDNRSYGLSIRPVRVKQLLGNSLWQAASVWQTQSLI